MCCLHDGMLHRKRLQVPKHCSELLPPLLCSSPIPCGVVVLLPQFPCLSPEPLPLFPPSVSVEGEDPSGKKSCRFLPD